MHLKTPKVITHKLNAGMNAAQTIHAHAHAPVEEVVAVLLVTVLLKLLELLLSLLTEELKIFTKG